MRRFAAAVLCALAAACPDFDSAYAECVDGGQCLAPGSAGGRAAGGSAAGGATAGGGAAGGSTAGGTATAGGATSGGIATAGGGTSGGTATAGGGSSGGTATAGGTGGTVFVDDGGYNYAFLTAQTFSGGFGSTAAADVTCSSIAADAGLVGPFIALLSSDDAGFAARLAHDAGWLRVDGVPLAADVTQLQTGRVYALLRVDERRNLISGQPHAWTGSTSGSPNLFSCAGWTSDAGPFRGTVGVADSVGLAFAAGGTDTCDVANHLYCLGNRNAARVPLLAVPPGGRRAFVSSFLVAGSVSNATAASMCEAEVQAPAGSFSVLRGSFFGSGFSVAGWDGGYVWYRSDGAPLARTPAQLRSPPLLLTPVGFRHDGGYALYNVWTGGDPEQTSPVDCNQWTSDAGAVQGSIGNATSATSPFNIGTAPCSASLSVYCVER